MADKGSKIVLEIYKVLESRIVKLEKELKSQQDLVKKLVLCMVELTNTVKSLPDKQIKKFMAFKYPFPMKETNLEISSVESEDPKAKMAALGIDLDQLSDLTFAEIEDFSVSMDTAEILETLQLP